MNLSGKTSVGAAAGVVLAILAAIATVSQQQAERMPVAMQEMTASGAFQTKHSGAQCRSGGGARGRSRQGIRGGRGRSSNLGTAQSAQAAKDTSELIQESIERSRAGSANLAEVVQAIASVTALSGNRKVQIEEVSAAREEQARGIEEISIGVRQMEQVTQPAAANAEQNAQSTDKVRTEAEAPDAIVHRLRGMME